MTKFSYYLNRRMKENATIAKDEKMKRLDYIIDGTLENISAQDMHLLAIRGRIDEQAIDKFNGNYRAGTDYVWSLNGTPIASVHKMQGFMLGVDLIHANPITCKLSKHHPVNRITRNLLDDYAYALSLQVWNEDGSVCAYSPKAIEAITRKALDRYISSGVQIPILN